MLPKPSEVTKAFQHRPTQAESNYIPLSTTAGEACANCRFFLNDGCWIIEEMPEPIIATGYCDRWEATPEPAQDTTEAIVEAVTGVVEAISDMPMMTEMSLDKALEEPSVLERIWKGLQSYINPEKEQSDLLIFKGQDGKTYWLAIFSNNFIDREGEIISEKAHKDYEMRLDMKLTPMPELWAWHTEGTKHGQADMVWYQTHNQYALGHFDDTPEAQKAISYYRKNPVKLSHGFIAPEWALKDGVYSAYNTFEISTLPPQVAANPYTSFEEIKSMPVPEKREAFIQKLFGDKAPDVLAKVNARDDQAKELATLVEFKDFASPSGEAEKPADESTKALSELFTENVEMTTEILGVIKNQVKALKDKDATIAALKSEKDTEVAALRKELEDVKKLVNMPPSRPSQSPNTLVTEKDKLKDALPQEPDNFFGDLHSKPVARNGATL